MDIIMNVAQVSGSAKLQRKKVFPGLQHGDNMPDAPPLKIWAYSVVTAFSLLFIFLFYCYSGYGPLAETMEKGQKNLEAALIENSTVDTSTVSVVILGSSLLERAVADSEELEERIFKQTKTKTKVLRVSLYNVNMDIAEGINFFKHITKYPPQYLFIENLGVNLKDAFWEVLPLPVEAAVLHLRNTLGNSVGLPLNENYFEKWSTYNTKPLPESNFYTGNFDSI